MPRQLASVLAILAGFGFPLGGAARAAEPPVYEVYAVRYAKMLDFPVAA